MVSIIIPTCNRVKLLTQCLECLKPSNQKTGFDYEIIVTDDSDTDIAQELLKQNFPWVKWVRGPRKGPAANRNNGAREANGEWLLFIDDDCLPSSQILKEYVISSNNNKEVLVFEGSIYADRPQQSFNEESPINENGGYLWSCNFMINKQLFFDSLQGFDERFPYPAMEDADLDYRIKKSDITILFVKNALVAHPWRKQNNTLSVTLKRFESILYFLEKHPEKKKSINSYYYFKIFVNGFSKGILPNLFKFRFRGLYSKLIFNFTHLYFSVYLISRSNKIKY